MPSVLSIMDARTDGINAVPTKTINARTDGINAVPTKTVNAMTDGINVAPTKTANATTDGINAVPTNHPLVFHKFFILFPSENHLYRSTCEVKFITYLVLEKSFVIFGYRAGFISE